MKDLIFIGIQGSGKGTQAKQLAAEYDYKIFETGGALRRMAKEESPLGKKIKEITERGDLVSNDIVMEIVEDFMSKISPEDQVIFDGIPRSEEQRIALENLLHKYHRDFLALEIQLSNHEALHRLLVRAGIEGRADDNIETIQKRIKNFYTYTAPLLEAWKKDNKLVVINGEQSVDNVARDIREKINNI